MDDFLGDWHAYRGDDERLWVVVPNARSREIIAYYAVEPDPVDLIIPGTEARCDDGVIYLSGLATSRNYQRQGWGTRLLMRVIHQIVGLPPEPGVDMLVANPLDSRAQAYLLGRNLGFEVIAPFPSVRVAVSIETLRDTVHGGDAG